MNKHVEIFPTQRTALPSGRWLAPGAVALAVSTLIGATSGAASAQTVAASRPAASDDALEQIVVTATRRSESIQDVPISVTAFSQADMDIQGVRSVDDIARLAPGIQFTRTNQGFGSDIGSSISIRGVSSTAGDATTGVYIDDTPIQVGSTVASGNFNDNAYPQLFDIQRVEVLRGPQGTLFGSGSEGGTVRFITPPPSLTTSSAYVRSEVSQTQYGAPSYEAGAAGGMPIIQDKLGFRASVWTRRDGGYVDAVDYFTGQTTSPNNNWQQTMSARFALGWQPIDGLMVTPSVFYQNLKVNGSGTFFLPSDGVTGSFVPGGPPLPAFQQPYGNVANGDYVDLHTVPQWNNQRLTLPAVKVDYALGPVELLSNTSYFDRAETGVTDFSAFQGGLFAGVLYPNPTWYNAPSSDAQSNHYFTQEFRVQSTNTDSRLKWVGGLYYSHDLTTFFRSVSAPYLGNMILAGPQQPVFGCTTPDECVLDLFGSPLQQGRYVFIQSAHLTEVQRAAFGQLDFKLTHRFTATVGLRYTRQSNDFVNAQGGAASGYDFPEYTYGASRNHSVTPKYMLSYKADNLLIYASASKGFRGGGANTPIGASESCASQLKALGLSSFPTTFNPDSVWSYELGTKFSTANGRFQLDASVFQINWANQIQDVSLPSCPQSFTTNIGTAQSRGFDFAAQWRALDPLLLTLNGGYQFAKATETIKSNPADPTSLNTVTNGDALPGSQPVVNAAAQYSFNVADKPSYFRVDYNYTGRTAKGQLFNPLDASYPIPPSNAPFVLYNNPSTKQTNVRLGTQLGNWDVSMFCNNLFNSQPLLNWNRNTITFSSIPTGMITANTLRPRTVGVTGVMRF